MDFTNGLRLRFGCATGSINFIKRGSNIAAIILFCLNNLKRLNIVYMYIIQNPEKKLDVFMCLQGFALQYSIFLEIKCGKQGTYVVSRIYGVEIENHMAQKTTTWLFDKLGLN